jgi:PAS domain S-box-containing protein
MKKRSRGGIGLERSVSSGREVARLLYRAIAESPIPLIIHDENSRILQVSRGWTRFSGYTIEDIPTLGDWRQRAYGVREPVQQSMGEVGTDQTVDDGDWLITAKDGSKRVWHFMVTPLGRFEGRRLLLATGVDVTERKRVEQTLLKTEELLKHGVHVAWLGIFDHDQVNETIYWSPEMRAICGMKPDETVTLAGWITRVYPEDRDVIARTIRQAHDPAGNGRYDVEHRIVHPDGSVHWVRIQSQTFFEGMGASRHPVRTVGAALDITGQKLAEQYRERLMVREQELRAAAESANKLKDDFLSTLSHELRTPLTSIIGWTSLLRDGQLDAIASRAIDTIERNARTQQRLIEEILDVSRIASGKFTFTPTTLELQPVIAAAVETIRPTAETRRIQLETSLSCPGVSIFGDSDRLLQMASNLLSNAVKFTPPGGTVLARLNCADSSARFIVTDTGEGIDPSFLPYVFDRFSQANSTTTRKHGGLGLGLAIVHHILELHGGTIRAESPGIGQGATFVVDLPILAPTDSMQPALSREV